MKMFLKFAIPLLFIFFVSPAFSNGENVSETVRSYLNALKIGDTVALKYYISGHFYKKRQVLLESNAEYSAFLKRFYGGARFNIIDTITDPEIPNKRIVTVEVEFPGGNKSLISFVVTKNSAGNWKITDERE